MNDFSKFCNNVLSDKSNNEYFEVQLSQNAKDKAFNAGINLNGFIFHIYGNSLRHIKNSHQEDLDLLPRIIPTINECDKATKSIIRDAQTGKNIINLVFNKRFDDDIMQLVAVRIHKGKILSLKTFFKK